MNQKVDQTMPTR